MCIYIIFKSTLDSAATCLKTKSNILIYGGVNKIVSWSHATSLKSHNLISNDRQSPIVEIFRKNGLPRANGPYLETKRDIVMGQTGNMVVTHIRQQTFTKNWLPKQKNRFFGWLGPIWGRHTILHLPCSRHRRAK